MYKLYKSLHNYTKLYKHFIKLYTTLHIFENSTKLYKTLFNFTQLYKHNYTAFSILFFICTHFYTTLHSSTHLFFQKKQSVLKFHNSLHNSTNLYTTIQHFFKNYTKKLYITLQFLIISTEFCTTLHNFTQLYKY